MLKRFSVSLDEKLLAQFDDYIRPRGYSNRSEAVRDLIRKMLVNEEWEQDSEVVGVVTLVYNHHQPQLQEKDHRGATRLPPPDHLDHPMCTWIHDNCL
jgi:Predicted transcriptional regulators containing the CopG/Arc/MetJ DNA-binding domain and a metal-binding domain